MAADIQEMEYVDGLIVQCTRKMREYVKTDLFDTERRVLLMCEIEYLKTLIYSKAVKE